jgi:hypothetical protein
MYPGGDQARESGAWLTDPDRTAALVAQSYLDPTTAGYGKWWLDHITPNPDVYRESKWEEFLWYREDLPALDYTQTLSTGYLAQGSGWMTSRSGWDKEATQVFMMAGPMLESHQDRDENGFLIYRGDWLAATAKLNSQSGLVPQASLNNSLTIGGQEQAWGPPPAKVLHYADTPQYAYFAGDASQAYDTANQKRLHEFRRELLFLKPSRIIVFDRVSAPDVKLLKQWHLNTLNEPTVNGNHYQASAGGSRLFGTSVLPGNGTVEKQPVCLGSDKPADHVRSSWRVDIAAPAGNPVDHFLNVLETAPASQTDATEVSAVRTSRGTLIGVQVGNQVVLFDTSPGQPISYQPNPVAGLEHFVLDQAPRKWYQIAVQSEKGEVLQQQREQASDQGVLAFPVTAVGGHTITIREGERG